MLISDRLTQIIVQAFVHHIAEAKQQMLVDKIANAVTDLGLATSK